MSKSDKPLVSVIMGVYNCEQTVGRAIESVLNQTYCNWEFIICDDGSTDHTISVINKYARQDSRIVVIKNKTNMRLAATLNNCLKCARGKYIARMDADDENLPQRLEMQVHFMETHPDYDVVGCSRIIFDDDGEHGVRESVEYPDKNILLKDTPFAHPTIMMKKSVYDELGGYRVSKETMRAEDLDLWFRFYARGFRGYNMPQVLYRYHESVLDYKKRSLRAGIQTAKVFLRGYKMLQVPLYKRIFGIKPIVVTLIPNVILINYHRRLCKGRKNESINYYRGI